MHKRYRKTATVIAVQMDRQFQVETSCGTQVGLPGDYLVTNEGTEESWPVPRDVFESTYEEVPQ